MTTLSLLTRLHNKTPERRDSSRGCSCSRARSHTHTRKHTTHRIICIIQGKHYFAFSTEAYVLTHPPTHMCHPPTKPAIKLITTAEPTCDTVSPVTSHIHAATSS
jgi:hypothetical protein